MAKIAKPKKVSTPGSYHAPGAGKPDKNNKKKRGRPKKVVKSPRQLGSYMKNYLYEGEIRRSYEVGQRLNVGQDGFQAVQYSQIYIG